MKHTLLSSLLSLSGILLGACADNDSSSERLQAALRLSGANRAELEKVIAHYSRHEADSLHLKAALFLIENMPGHHALESEYLKRYRRSMDSLYPQMPKTIRSIVYTIPLRNQIDIGPCTKIEDVQVVKADFLIKHIDNRMEMWRNCIWLADVPFENFCDYLLPYRISEEPLVQDDSTAFLWKKIKREVDYFGYKPYFLEEIESLQQIGDSEQAYLSGIEIARMPDVKFYQFDCEDNCYYETWMARNSGIPSTTDFVPEWATRNGRHYWFQIIDSKKVAYTYGEGLIPHAAKVYRKTYSHNPIPQSETDSVPVFFTNPFHKM